jgi:hypothetical protein
MDDNNPHKCVPNSTDLWCCFNCGKNPCAKIRESGGKIYKLICRECIELKTLHIKRKQIRCTSAPHDKGYDKCILCLECKYGPLQCCCVGCDKGEHDGKCNGIVYSCIYNQCAMCCDFCH